MSRKKIIWTVLLLVLACAALYGYKEYTRRNKDLLYTKPDFKFTAPALLAVFEKNDPAAGILYNGKIVEITGQLKAVEKDERSYVTLVIADSAGASSIRCSMDTSHVINTEILHAPMNITVRGACTGYNKDEMGLGSDLILNRAVLIDPKK
jgi:hypothetical protein